MNFATVTSIMFLVLLVWVLVEIIILIVKGSSVQYNNGRLSVNIGVKIEKTRTWIAIVLAFIVLAIHKATL